MTQSSTRRDRLQARAASGLGLVSVLLLAACTSLPEPIVAFAAAEQAIATADQARVADTAMPELSEAREKLTAARAAVQDKQMVQGERLALEARVDAELASAKAEAAKAKAVNDEMKRSTDTLTQEMQRNSGARK
jgi:putative cell wall-binding protein